MLQVIFEEIPCSIDISLFKIRHNDPFDIRQFGLTVLYTLDDMGAKQTFLACDLRKYFTTKGHTRRPLVLVPATFREGAGITILQCNLYYTNTKKSRKKKGWRWAGQHPQEERQLYCLPSRKSLERVFLSGWTPHSPQLLFSQNFRLPRGGCRLFLISARGEWEIKER